MGVITRYQALRFGLDWGFMSLELLGLGLVASLCGAVRAASTRFDVIYTWPRFKVSSPRETLLQGIAVVARWSGSLNRLFTMYQRTVSNPQAAWKHEILSKTETGPKTSNYRKIKAPCNREASMVGLEAEHLNIITVKSKAMQPFDLCVVGLHTPDRSRADSFVAHSSPPENTYV